MSKIKILQGQGPHSLVKKIIPILCGMRFMRKEKNVGPQEEHSRRDWGWQKQERDDNISECFFFPC